MLVFNKRVGQEYKKFINGEYKEIGSFRSNFFKISKAKKNMIFYLFLFGEMSF